MSGEAEYGKCDMCGRDAELRRRYYNYDIQCECHGPSGHFEIVRHCKYCMPKAPEKITVTVKPKDLYEDIPEKLACECANSNGLRGPVYLSELSDVPLSYKFVYGKQDEQLNLWHIRKVYQSVPECKQHNIMESVSTQGPVPGSRVCKRCLKRLKEYLI